MTRNNYLKIDVNIRDHFGSNTTAIVFCRLMYWFSKKPDGFCKFKQPCENHHLYKKGNSWSEELGMGRKVIDRIFSELITHYKNKSDYLKCTDRFAGKIFLSYTDRQSNLTWYFVDKDALNKFLESVSVKNALPTTKSGSC